MLGHKAEAPLNASEHDYSLIQPQIIDQGIINDDLKDSTARLRSLSMIDRRDVGIGLYDIF
ncbi:hypothetical protein GFS31_36810 [Leptolyngbya sp. BL0902]|nr:hypothetical protein GFS31_36810 [Leptolyngbya sp. BL0902]